MPRVPHTSPQTLSLFAALMADPARWRYGYDLSKETALASGTLYPILMRLTEQRLLETRWEPSDEPGRPARHLYRLTADGVALAGQRLSARRPVTVNPSVRTRTAGGAA
ncbi:PadR family transcriptional regulator [Actinoplanes sp. NPDC049548]|uniref:PadR family transcriptional regulator n=1 Tax=Actinoplanes sp. NPDC049548 TaxID=3155152 RepID=UPI0034482388